MIFTAVLIPVAFALFGVSFWLKGKLKNRTDNWCRCIRDSLGCSRISEELVVKDYRNAS